MPMISNSRHRRLRLLANTVLSAAGTWAVVRISRLAMRELPAALRYLRISPRARP